jgi:phage gp36-like protein
LSQYAGLIELKALGLPPSAFVPPKGVSIDEFEAAINQQCIGVSTKVDTYLRGRYAVPLTGALATEATKSTPATANTYPAEFVKAVTDIEALELLTWRGFNPDQFDQVYVTRSDAAYAWLKDIAKGTAVVDLPPPDPGGGTGGGSGSGRAGISSKPSRGW